MISLRRAYFAVVCGLGLLVALPLVFAAISLRPRPVAWRISQRIYRVIFGLLGIRIRTRGLEGIDPGEPFILMPNHVSLLDHFALCIALPTPIIGVEKQENFRIPIYGRLMRRWGNVPIDRSRRAEAQAGLRAAGEALRAGGVWLLIFPEGTRTRDGALGPFKKGGFHLAREAGVRVLPCALVGAWAVKAAGGAWTRPGTIEVVLGAPITLADAAASDVASLADGTRAAVQALLDAADERGAGQGARS